MTCHVLKFTLEQLRVQFKKKSKEGRLKINKNKDKKFFDEGSYIYVCVYIYDYLQYCVYQSAAGHRLPKRGVHDLFYFVF